MSYNPAIPTINDTLFQSQAQIRANFQSINTTFSNNHFSLIRGSQFQGMHTVLTMQPQSDPSTDATHVAFYNKIVSSVPQLFFRPINNQTPIQLTYSSLVTGPAVTDQYSFVAGPFVIYMGKVTNVTNGQTVILSPTTTLRYVGLGFTNHLFPSVRGLGFVLNAIPTNISGSSFDISFSSTIVAPDGLDVYYLAIGN